MRLGRSSGCSHYLPASSSGFDNSIVLEFGFRASGLGQEENEERRTS